MGNLAATYVNLGKYSEGDKLQIQAQEAQSKAFVGEHSHQIKSMLSVEEAQVLNTRRTVPEEEI